MSQSIYKYYTPEQKENLASSYMITHWSYSAVSCFSRNEKAFEMIYLYGEKGKRSATSVAGSAYHKALEVWFNAYKNGIELGIVELQSTAYAYIDKFPKKEWRLQKKTATIDKCISRTTEIVNNLLENFLKEKSLYLEDIKEILGVELQIDEWLVVSKVDIPLPCKAVLDLVVRTKDDRVVVIDHKSRNVLTGAKEQFLRDSKQAMIYALCYETAYQIMVDEVWIIENKYSKNTDRTPQMQKLTFEQEPNSRALHEITLYGHVRRMLEAVANPDFIYLNNDLDNIADQAELFDFHCRTLLGETVAINVPMSKREAIDKRLKKIKDSGVTAVPPTAIKKFKASASEFIEYNIITSNMTTQEKIAHTLRTFGVFAEVAHYVEGFSSDTYLLDVASGTKIADVKKYALNLARDLNVSGVRIPDTLIKYNDKVYLATEAPKLRTETLYYDTKYLDGLKIPIGLTNFREPLYWDLNCHSTPHVLVCGSTGSGKSVMLKSTLEYALAAGVDDVVILDPKYEFTQYKDLQVYNSKADIESIMELLVEEMQRRIEKRIMKHTLVIFDEFADAVIASRRAKSRLEENLQILLQTGRSCGFRLLVATQRASVDIINGTAKNNLPVQVCFRVPKSVDSKVVLDEEGAELLQGGGDGLFQSPSYFGLQRFQGFFKPDDYENNN